jgi:DNA-binding NtrC family response regulator
VSGENGGRILVVDDKANMRALLRDILTVRHDVRLAADVAGAVALLEAEPADVVLTDVRMPVADGFALAQSVKRRWPTTEVVLMTAHASVPAAVEAMRQGAYDYIEKPFDPDDVSLVVARALERSRERAHAAPSPDVQTQIGPDGKTPPPRELAELSYREALAEARDRGSREYLTALLTAFGGNVSRAAAKAGLERESLHRLMRRHGIRADGFRDGGGGPGSG